MRVVSLLPSATEILCAISGGREFLVGRSHECDFPAGLDDLPVLTSQRTHAAASAEIDRQVCSALQSKNGDSAGASLYTLDENLLRSLRPDVILTQDLCEVCSIDLNTVRAVSRCLDPEPRIVSLNPMMVEGVFDDVLRVGEAIGLEAAAQAAVVALRERYWSARDFVNPYIDGPEVGFLEWMDPLFCGGHWTPQLIETAGGRHSLNRAGEKSRRIAPEELLEVMPARLIICPCGYGIEQTRREMPTLVSQRWWNMLPAVQDGQVVIVDGSAMFNRPGPRLIEAYCWLVAWLNDRPEVMPRGFPCEPFHS
jgi:ABC-type Fe3+-hydroxamate transport system substrate-binding protein